MDTENRIIQSVMNRIAETRKNQTRRNVAIFGTFFLGALATLPVTINYLVAATLRSGFTEYLTLFIHEGVSVFQYWQEFTLSLIDSAPIIELTSFIAIVLVFVYSVRSLVSSLSILKEFNSLKILT